MISAIRLALFRLKLDSSNVLNSTESIARDISIIRANSSLLLTPDLINEFIDSDAAAQLTTSLIAVRNSLAVLLAAIRDVGRLVVAHGSVHELLSRSVLKDTMALSNFVNNYNRVRNNLLSSVASYKQTAQTGFNNFISRVRSTYNDTIVRSKFEQAQLPLIQSFADVINTKVYNQTFFQTSFDTMRDSIVGTFTKLSNSSGSRKCEHRDTILDLQRTSFVRRYSNCLNELVSEALESSNTIASNYAFCLNERTSGIVVVIPSTSSWMSVIRDNINFILQQLNACLTGQNTVIGRLTISDCIQYVS